MAKVLIQTSPSDANKPYQRHDSQSSDGHPFLFTDIAHSRDFVNNLCLLRQHEEFCDMVLMVGNKSITTHKVVLASNSPYFRAMFTGGLLESRQSTVTLQELEESAMEAMVDFFYSGKIQISELNVQDLLHIACLLQVQSVKKACCEFLKRQLSPENCIGICALADAHSCRELLTTSELFARNHFVEVVQGEEFMEMSAKQLARLVLEDELSVHSEERVFEAVVAWIKYDIQGRQEYASEVLRHVRFPLLSAEFLMDRVATEELIRNDRLCSDLLFEATTCLLLPRRKSQIAKERVQPRRPMSVNKVLYAIGGMSRREASKSGEKFDPKEGKWKPIGDMSICRWGADVGALGPYLYICGGSDDASRLDTVERFDPFSNVWVPSVPMATSRNGVGVVAGNGRIYAIGGFDGSMPLNTAEYYDSKTGRWTEIARMNQCRFGVGCVVLDNYVYAVGGSDGTNLKTVERYDPETNRWSFVAPMNTARKQVGVASLGGYIYAIGGCDHGKRYDTVERYDPAKNEWLDVCSMSTPRSGCGVGVLDGLVYAVGGYDGTMYLQSVERYDPLTNQWYQAPPLSQPRDCVAVCVATSKRVTCSSKRLFEHRNSSPPSSNHSHSS
ncbi:kelch-like protein diablo [Actinia tenebrosa]|uniref:Kelch-like protein diablo n=1 Tax=Actinia tenebrosa TaxID=6105 RepID=A0A6P8J477_ACTTE|nr:kelch-like protein diablo [Actinia tenebrosa]